MALSIKEGTKHETMKLFKIPGGFEAGYVVIKNVEIKYTEGYLDILIGKYVSEKARNENVDNCVNEFVGFPLTSQALGQIAGCDDRDIIYPYLEAQMRYLDLKDKSTEAIQAIYDEYGLSNPYQREI